MENSLEVAVSRLDEFIQAVQRRAGALMPTGVRVAPRARFEKTPLQETYEKCVNRLSAEDRAHLVRIIEEMSRDL
jgi:hypothetical protein